MVCSHANKMNRQHGQCQNRRHRCRGAPPSLNTHTYREHTQHDCRQNRNNQTGHIPRRLALHTVGQHAGVVHGNNGQPNNGSTNFGQKPGKTASGKRKPYGAAKHGYKQGYTG